MIGTGHFQRRAMRRCHHRSLGGHEVLRHGQLCPTPADLLDFVERQQPHKLVVDLSSLVCLIDRFDKHLTDGPEACTSRGGTMKLFGLSQNRVGNAATPQTRRHSVIGVRRRNDSQRCLLIPSGCGA